MNKEKILELLHSNNEDDIKLGCIILVKTAVDQKKTENVIGPAIKMNTVREIPILYKYHDKTVYCGVFNILSRAPFDIEDVQIINLDEDE